MPQIAPSLVCYRTLYLLKLKTTVLQNSSSEVLLFLLFLRQFHNQILNAYESLDLDMLPRIFLAYRHRALNGQLSSVALFTLLTN